MQIIFNFGQTNATHMACVICVQYKMIDMNLMAINISQLAEIFAHFTSTDAACFQWH